MHNQKIIIIMAYYNFSASTARARALECCIKSLPAGLDIMIVAMGPIPDVSRKNTTIFKVRRGSVLWQRERFWNLALDKIEKHYGIVAWLDADVVFKDENWVDCLECQLQESRLVHLYSNVKDVRLADTGFQETGVSRESVVSWLHHSNPIEVRNYFSLSGVSLSLGCSPGFAWATKADLIVRNKFPEFLILGSGDKAFLAASLGYHREYVDALRLNPNMKDLYLNWADDVFADIQGKAGLIQYEMHHIIQGEYGNRRYHDRYQILADPLFRISDYIHNDEQEGLVWRDEANPYALAVQEYFKERND